MSAPRPGVRRSPFAGTWYPGEPDALEKQVARCLDAVPNPPPGLAAALVGLVAPHAGLVYSGPVAAHAYRLAGAGEFETVILLGPSHQRRFDALAVYPAGAFETPLGEVPVDAEAARRLLKASPHCRAMPEVHAAEHCLEMQLPFLQRTLPRARIVPVMMGEQSPVLVRAAAEALASVARESTGSVLLVASSDLSHYESRARARALDEQVLDCVEAFAPERLARLLQHDPRHACGGGPIVSVMEASRNLGGERAELLEYGDSGDASGDTDAVVGYAAAAFLRGARSG